MKHLRSVSRKRMPSRAQLECYLCLLIDTYSNCLSKGKCSLHVLDIM